MIRSTLQGRTLALSLLVFIVCGQAASQIERPSTSFAAIAKRVEPAVVSIDTKSKIVEPQARATPAPGASDDIMEFFRRQMQQRPVYGVGSGFLVDKTGYIVTNAHVVSNAANITVKLDTGEQFQAKIVGADEETDVAVLKIDARRELPFLKFGSSAKAEVGDWVLAVGSPFGLAKSVTAGIISQKQRETQYASAFQKFIQTDAAINPGNSGGALVDASGAVIGINTAIAGFGGSGAQGGSIGLGFAIPIDAAREIGEELIATGNAVHAALGVNAQTVTDGERDGAQVNNVEPGSPAASAGLQEEDVIIGIGDREIRSSEELVVAIDAYDPGDTITIEFVRGTGSQTVQAVLGQA